jgi:tetratricopeptide (TPR) repeat protein
MSEAHAREMFEKALEAISDGQEFLALSYFEQARTMENEPLYLSSKALCLAKVRRSFKEAIYLCRDALEIDPKNPAHYLNLGKIYLFAGQKKKALSTFRDGLRHGRNSAIVAELENLGVRRPPFFKFLGRKHPLNKYSGILLSKIGLR